VDLLDTRDQQDLLATPALQGLLAQQDILGRPDTRVLGRLPDIRVPLVRQDPLDTLVQWDRRVIPDLRDLLDPQALQGTQVLGHLLVILDQRGILAIQEA
jgi:hypothetical protein